MTKILLVEDDKNLREIYGTRLYAEGYDIVSAGDGEAALAMAIKERPDLIISDVMMPKISGFDMLDILRSTTETKNIPVIMMTALSSEDQQARGESLGANRYLVKSQVGIEDVVRTVHEVLQDAPGMQQQSSHPTNTNNTTQNTSGQSAPRSQSNSVSVPQRSSQQQPQQAYQHSTQPQQQPAPQQYQSNQQQSYSQPQQPSSQNNQQSAQVQQQWPQQHNQPAPQQPDTSSNQQPDDGSLPRPIAPFSTKRPAGLGDRVIHPLERADDGQSGDNVAEKMAAALSSTPSAQHQATTTPQTQQSSSEPQSQNSSYTNQPQPQSEQPQQQQQPQPNAQQQGSQTPEQSTHQPLPYDLPPVQPQQQQPAQPTQQQQNYQQ